MKTFNRIIRTAACAGVAAVALVPAMAWAQEEAGAQAEAAADEGEEIVVTGTQVRGVAPPGANPISVSTEAIRNIGATNVNQVLQSVPQLGSFGSLQQPLAASREVSVNRPNLRNLPGFNNAGGSSTLVLMDGHRMVGMGVASTTPDPDVIPPSVIERVEIVPDGGSAVYGSDAVAGVLNFITIKRFDGVKVDASYGFADNYYSWDANVLAGRDWGSGSLFAAYSYSKNDELLGIDRDYIREFPSSNFNNVLTRQLTCPGGANFTYRNGPAGSPTIVNRVNADGTFTPNAANDCDGSDYASVFPKAHRHSVFVGLTQELDDTTTIDLRAYYSRRETLIRNGYYTYQYTYGGANPPAPAPYNDPGNPNDSGSTVFGAYGPAGAVTADATLATWGVTPTITKKLGDNFQLRVLYSYGESTSTFVSRATNQNAVNAAIGGGLFNPFRPDLANPAILSQLSNFHNYNRSNQTFHNVRAVLDGSLFEFAGGAVKMAAGVEYSRESFRATYGDAVPGFEISGYNNGGGSDVIPSLLPLPRYNLSRNVKSAFGELIIPFFGADNATPGIQELTLSLAGRYDSYSDFGDTFNPRIGLTYKPLDWLSIRGAWGTSFNAPSLADDGGAIGQTIFFLPCNFANLCPPQSLIDSGQYPAISGGNNILAVRGNAPGIKPQTATTWTLGFDARPVPGLSFGVSYYNIDFRDLIGLPPFENGPVLYRDYQQVLDTSFTQGDINAIWDLRDDPGNTCGRCFGSPTTANTYVIIDARKNNLGGVKVNGLDFNLNYRGETDFGAVYFGISGTYTLSLKTSPSAGAPYVQTIDFNNSRLKVRTNLGAEVGPVMGQLFWNHQGGYDLSPTVGVAGFALSPQRTVGAFNTFDLALRYNVGGTGIGEDLSFRLNVNNLFDSAPPEYIALDSVAGRRGIRNGATLGRFVQFGVSKKF